jgi:hypothetical protein
VAFYLRGYGIHNKWAASSVYKFFDNKANRTLKRFKENWINILTQYEHSTERNDGSGGVLDMVLEYQRMSKCQETLTLNEVAETMIEIIFANQDVLLPAICWLFVDLMIYPQYIELIDWTNIDDRMINKSDLESIHKDLLCIITESARVHPFFPLSFPEILHKEIKLGGYTLPEGTHVCIDQYSLNHNSNYWQKPNEFQPERFYEVDDFTKKWGSFRFGFGGRRCPGQHYANLILANAVAKLFSKYQLVPIDIDDVSDHTNAGDLDSFMRQSAICCFRKINIRKKYITN